jgi:hypothetical protein
LWSGISSKTGYYYAYKETEWLVTIATAFLIIGVFVVCVSHFDAPWVLAAGMAAVLGGGAVVLAVQFAGGLVGGLWSPAIGALLSRGGNMMLGATAFLLSSRAIFFVLRATPLSINATRSFWACTALTSGAWVNYGVTLAGAPVRLTQGLAVGVAIICTILWMRLSADGEYRGPRDRGMPIDVIESTRRGVIRLIHGYWDRGE